MMKNEAPISIDTNHPTIERPRAQLPVANHDSPPDIFGSYDLCLCAGGRLLCELFFRRQCPRFLR